MSNLSQEIERQMADRGVTVDDLVKKMNVSRGLIYLWKRGTQTSIGPDQMAALAKALSKSRQDHTSLVIAHLRDECYGPGSNCVKIESTVEPPPEKVFKSKRDLALAFLTELSRNNREAKALIIDLAKLLGCKL